MSADKPEGVQGCARCMKREYFERLFDIAINRHAWATVLRTVIPLAEKNALTVELLAAMCEALRNDLFNLQLLRKNDMIFKSLRTEAGEKKVFDLMFEAFKGIIIDPSIIVHLDLAVSWFSCFDAKKPPFVKRIRKSRRKSI